MMLMGELQSEGGYSFRNADEFGYVIEPVAVYSTISISQEVADALLDEIPHDVNYDKLEEGMMVDVPGFRSHS